MKNIYKFGIIALLQFPLVNTVQAEQLVIINPQASGKVSVFRSGVDLNNWKFFPSIKVAPPQGATAVIFEKGKPPRWSTTALPKLYRRLGGTGNLEQEIFETGKMPKNIKISSGSDPIELPEATNKEIELFASILPFSGKWNTELKNLSSTGCPPMISSVLARQSTAAKTREFSFPTSFHPNQLFLNATPIKWQQSDIDKWHSTLADFGPNTKVKSKDMSFKVVWDVNVASATQILIKSNINVKLAPVLAAAFGGSTECDVIISGAYNYIGN